VVAHNLPFDENVIGAEFLRKGLDIPFLGMRKICTMKGTTAYCRLAGPYGYKWPTLAELHWVLFGETLKEIHNAEADVTACARCFFGLKRRRVLKVGSGRT
jgi:DNA polymerase III epsilon subunit-like protein